MSQPTLRLVDRLRGIYTIPVNDGAGPFNGSDTFTCEFETPPIQKEAAAVIDAMKEALLEVHSCGNAGARLSRTASDKVRAVLSRLFDSKEI